MFNLIENPNIEEYQIIASNKRKFENNYLLCVDKLYKIKYDNIKKNDLLIKGYTSSKNVSICEYNIQNIIDRIDIQIIDSIKYEINEKELLNNIYIYLKDLFVFDKMKINLNNIKLLVTFTAFNKYYLINNETKIIIRSTNNYKLYNNIFDIDNKSLIYITFNISHIHGSFKRNLLDDINLINTKDFDKELDNNKNCLYDNKKFNFFSNNCEFEAIVTFMNLSLEEKQKKISSETIYNFTEDNIINKKVYTNNVFIANDNKTKHNISIVIEECPKKNHIYDLYKLQEQIYNKLKFNYVKLHDKFKINIDDDILIIKIMDIDNPKHSAIYISDEIIRLSIQNNSIDNIFAYKPELTHYVESLDVNIKKYNNISFKSLFGGDDKNSIPEIDINDITNLIRNTHYFLYNDLTHIKDKFVFEYSNIIVKDKLLLNDCLLKIVYCTKINIIVSDECNIKLINSNLSNGSNINMTIEEIKNIKTKLVEYGLTGMDEQIDKVIREVLLPRSNFINEKFKKIIKLPKGILLYGPPGTGKTTLARNIAKVIGITNDRIKMLNATEIFSKFLGESEENIRKLFKSAKEDKKNLHLVIIDEVDSIFKSRSSSSCDNSKSDVVNQFLGEMDGLESINNIIIIGITNKIDLIDSAILRPGRFSCKIYCGLPNEKERLNIIKLYHNRIIESVNFDKINFDKLVKITNNFSGAQIEYIYVKIVELVIESQFNEKEIIITNKIINDIIDTI